EARGGGQAPDAAGAWGRGGRGVWGPPRLSGWRRGAEALVCSCSAPHHTRLARAPGHPHPAAAWARPSPAPGARGGGRSTGAGGGPEQRVVTTARHCGGWAMMRSGVGREGRIRCPGACWRPFLWGAGADGEKNAPAVTLPHVVLVLATVLPLRECDTQWARDI